jgi:hypothetical protein
MFITSGLGYGEKILHLEKVLKPYQLVIDSDTAYICEEFEVHIYSMSNNTLLKSFGRKGEGPGEFSFAYPLFLSEGQIFYWQINKVMYFSKMGDFIREKRLAKRINRLVPVQENFVGTIIDFETKDEQSSFKYCLFDKDFNTIRKLESDLYLGRLIKNIRKRDKKIDRHLPRCTKRYFVYENKIFLGDPGEGIYFNVYNHQGKLDYKIDLQPPRERVTEEYIKEYMDKQKESKNWERNKNRYNYIFAKYFPAFQWFKIADDKIYLIKHQILQNCKPIIVLDLQGKILGESTIPEVGVDLSAFSGNWFYYITENEDEEVWELHREEIIL